MGDGLKNATLEALCSRGPWRGSTEVDPPWTLTAAELQAYYQAIRIVAPTPWAALGLRERSWASHRKTDRANQLLKKAGLIQFDKERKRWVAVNSLAGSPSP